MASNKRPTASSGDDPYQDGSAPEADSWIFAPEPGTFATEKLPDRHDFERLRAEKADLEGEPERLFAPLPSRSSDLQTTEIEALPAMADLSGEQPSPEHSAAMPNTSHATFDDLVRSGATPAAAPRQPATILPPRFRDLSGWDALRDLLVALCFGSAFATSLTSTWGAVSMLWPRIAAGIGLATLIAVYALRWGPTYRENYDPAKPPNLKLLGTLRALGMLPAFAVAVGVMGYDLVMSIPDLFPPLPSGPRVGVGAGVALLLLGSIVGAERRGFEGYVPGPKNKSRAAIKLHFVRWLAIASFVLALVMMVGKAINGDPLFALMTFSRSLGAFALVLLIVRPHLNQTPAWYVFITGVAGAMVLGGAADNTLRLEYAAPASFSTAYVWLPFLFAAFGILISRAYVRSSDLRFTRVDWIVYAARAFEFSIIMHTVAIVMAVVQMIAVFAGYSGPTSPTLALLNVVFLGIILGLSYVARYALVNADATKARSHAVSACVALTVVGFFGILVYSLASGAAAGLLNGGLALIVGVVAALMVAVPTPVPDEYGAPDLERTFAQFRSRDAHVSTALPFLPDASKAAARKTFPS